MAPSSCLWQTSPMFDDPRSSSLPPISESGATPSFFVTLKVLQILHSLCKRAHIRDRLASTLASKQRARAKQQPCQFFELEAYAKIDKYLGRKTTRKHCRSAKYRRSLEAVITSDDLQEPVTLDNTKCTLDLIDKHSQSKSRRLAAVARSEKLFLERDTDFALQPLSLNQLSQLLVVTRNLLNTFNRTKHGRRVQTLCEADEVINTDDTYIANLHHLLLCLYHRLIELLIYRLVELAHKHLIESQKDQEKQWIDWFFEFPDARHPLNTTWPWSIRPSLAVIWGVCWMFFDSAGYQLDQYGNMVDVDGTIIVPYSMTDMAEQYLRSLQAQRVAGQSGGNNAGRDMQSERVHQGRRIGVHVHDHVSHRAEPQLTIHHAPPMSIPGPFSLEPSQRPNNTRGGLGNHYTSPSTATAHVANHYWQPQEHFSTPGPAVTSGLGYQHRPAHSQASADVSADVSDAWALDFGLDGSSRYLPRQSGTPVIRVQTAGLPSTSQPQDNTYHSATSAISSASSLNHSDGVYAPSYNFYHNAYNKHNLSPHSPRPFSAHMEISGPMLATVSPISPRPHNHTEEQVMSQLVHEMTGGNRKRSFDQMSQDGKPQMHMDHPHSRAVSIASAPERLSPTAEQGSPRGGSRSFRRNDPPTNSDGKLCCNYSNECSALTFDRKCEWSKHMDKHDRPYRCQDPLCAKLQGFTYSGGLLRHEREVHNKHGGPKEQLVCPIADCKRHSGKGFTRKENLHEHMRRVHENKTQIIQSPDAAIQANMDALHGVSEGPHLSGPPELSGMVGPDDLVDALQFDKLKRSVGEDSLEMSVNDIEGLQHQLKRLRAENEEKDKRLRMLEAAETERQQELEGYKEALAQLQQSRDVQSLQDA